VPVIVTLTVRPSERAKPALSAPGHLILSWFDRDEAAFYHQHGRMSPASVCPFVARARIVAFPPKFLQPGVEHELVLPMRAAGVYPVAVFDHAGALWSAMMEGTGSSLVGVATEPVARRRSAIVLQALPLRREGARLCDRPRCRHRMIPGEAGTGHRICVYLPPDYGRSGRPHPVVYMLPGLGEDEGVRFEDQEFVDAVDANPGGDGPGPILVGVDARTAEGSAYVGDAETAWTRFLTRDLITAVETEFDGARDWRRRVLVGHGTGGFNAVRLALTHPEIFGTVAVSAPDALDLDSWLLSPGGAIKQLWGAWIRMEHAVGGRGQMRSYAASWSPTASGVQWPIDVETGRTRYEVLLRWLQQSPLRRIERSEAQRALRVLEGRLFIGASRRDEFGLLLPTRRFSERLTVRGIDHQFLPDDFGHFDASPRLVRLIAMALARV
jgi:pimeloyl-ACP methyl ester carboxylesterase